jgi:3-oxoacyl-[acyl-carrier protein] reductase
MSQSSRQVALVTGSRRGIGLGVALALAREGFELILNGVSSEADEALERVRECGVRAEYLQGDVSSREDRGNLLAQIKEKFGRLDVLVNNAGVAPKVRADILEASEESFERLININLMGPYFLTQAAANWMIEQKKEAPEREPKIITVSSISAFTASPSRGEYCVSKAGLSMMTKLFAARLGEYGIKVYEIRPGIISTDLVEKVKQVYDQKLAEGFTPINRWGTPDDCGKTVAALAAGHLPFSTGEAINVDGGFHLRIL